MLVISHNPAGEQSHKEHFCRLLAMVGAATEAPLSNGEADRSVCHAADPL